RVLREREPERRPPAMEPGEGDSAAWPVQESPDPDVQRLRSGRESLQRVGPAQEFLKAIAYLKPVIFTAALIPAAVLAYGVYIAAVNGDTRYVGADPLAYITNQTGWWALSFLMMALAVTPIRRLTGWNALIRPRRMVRLFFFFFPLLPIFPLL